MFQNNFYLGLEGLDNLTLQLVWRCFYKYKTLGADLSTTTIEVRPFGMIFNDHDELKRLAVDNHMVVRTSSTPMVEISPIDFIRGVFKLYPPTREDLLTGLVLEKGNGHKYLVLGSQIIGDAMWCDIGAITENLESPFSSSFAVNKIYFPTAALRTNELVTDESLKLWDRQSEEDRKKEKEELDTKIDLLTTKRDVLRSQFSLAGFELGEVKEKRAELEK